MSISIFAVTICTYFPSGFPPQTGANLQLAIFRMFCFLSVSIVFLGLGRAFCKYHGFLVL